MPKGPELRRSSKPDPKEGPFAQEILNVSMGLRLNVERPNIERLNVKQPGVDFYNIERLNIERPNVDYDWTLNIFYNTGPDSPLQALGDENTELFPLVRLG
jgi:hypothetical protein